MTTLRRQTTLTIAAALIIALALLLTWSTANAQEPPETGTRLEPGLNLVGWVGEPTPVSQLFREIPQLESIWAWDAELRDWIVAGRGAPEWLGGLGRVTAGMGLRMQLGGDQPYLWQRSTEPTRGLVKLRTGWNLVAWSGADETPIDDALKGIGWSLRTVRRWNPATQQWSIWTSPERTAQLIAAANADQEDDDSQTPAISRGEALWINVARAVNWLQPTDILPRLVFPGGASQQLQTRVREDLEAVLAFYRTQYGVQADPDFTIYAAKDVDALIQAYKDDGDEVDDAYEASERALWNRAGGWAGGDIVVKQSHWTEDLSDEEVARGRYIVTHEYFHILQRQLVDAWNRVSQWLTEGTADWTEGEHKVLDGQLTWNNLRDRELSEITDNTPTLRSTESENAQWEYTLGWLATDQLIANTAPDFPIEFWRQLASTEIGPHGRWASAPDWRTALQQVSGQAVSEFYAVFDAWQREQATANKSSEQADDEVNWISGRVIGDDGAPVAGVFVNAIRVEGATGVGWNRRAETDADGSFAVRAPEDGDYRLSVDINHDCTRYYSHGELVAEEEGAQPVQVAGADARGIEIQAPANVCGWQIRGHVVGPDSEPLASVLVEACSADGHLRCQLSNSTADGSFAVTVAESGGYHISAYLGNRCSVYFRPGVPTTIWSDASRITVTDAHVSGILIQLPKDLCRLRVAGFLGDIELLRDGYVGISLCRMADNGCSRLAVRSGLFTVTIPTPGAYRLTYDLNDGCEVHYGPTGVTASATDAALINVDSRDVRLAYRQIPANVCAYQIAGSITKADGQPLADTWVTACLEEDGKCLSRPGSYTDDDGAFAITAPTDGQYSVWFRLKGCTGTIYFRSGGLTTTSSERSTVRVERRSVRLSPRQLPAGMCGGHRISGRFVDSNGAPLPEKWINVRWPGGSGGAYTDANGRFEIRVRSDGTYTFSIQLRRPNCWSSLSGTALGSPDNPVRVSGADVTGITLRLPATVEELCN